ncbi:hypothetical protein D3C72_1248140 [compost metagenome]
MTQQLHQQPGRVAAGARAKLQGLLRCLYTGFEPDQVANVQTQALIEGNQKIDAGLRAAINALQVIGERGGQRQLLQVGHQLVAFVLGIVEGNLLGVGLKKEVEGVEHRHFGNQVDFYP